MCQWVGLGESMHDNTTTYIEGTGNVLWSVTSLSGEERVAEHAETVKPFSKLIRPKHLNCI